MILVDPKRVEFAPYTVCKGVTVVNDEQEAIDKFLDSVELEKRSDGGGEDPEEEKRKQQEAFEMEQAQLRHQLFMMQLGY